MRSGRHGRFWPHIWRIAEGPAVTGKINTSRLLMFGRDRPALTKKKITQKVLAVILITAMLSVAGVAPVAIACVLVAGVLIFIAVRRSARRETEIIFAFYAAADEVLRDNDGRRYRFEVSEVIHAGEQVVASMPDPPPLASFALGALYSLIGDHNAVVEHLGIAAEEELMKDSTHASPSRRLRRYVRRLRQIQRAPERWPKLHAAIASLERMHQERGARLLAESQQHLKRLVEAYQSEVAEQSSARQPVTNFTGQSLRAIKAPPPISEVLTDVYPEEYEA